MRRGTARENRELSVKPSCLARSIISSHCTNRAERMRTVRAKVLHSGQHGQVQVKEGNRKVWMRRLTQAAHAVALAMLVVLLLVQSRLCLKRYLADPTYLDTYIVEQHEAQFPAMTVCPDVKGYKTDVLQVGEMIINLISGDGQTYFIDVEKSDDYSARTSIYRT